MRFDRIATPCVGLALAMLSAAAAHADNSPLGVWIDHTGRGAVEINECEGKLCGRVAWVKDAENAKDCGKQIIGAVAPVGKNKWDNGWIYDPDRGQRFDVELTALEGDKLRVKGYAGTKWLSETYTWKRAPGDLQTCTAGQAAQATPAAATKPVETKSAETTKADEKSGASGDQLAPVDLNATASEADKADTNKSGVARSDAPATTTDKTADTAKAGTPDDDWSKAPKASGKGEGKVLARVMEELGSGDGPVKLKRSGKTCKVTAPYVGVISFPCDGKDD